LVAFEQAQTLYDRLAIDFPTYPFYRSELGAIAEGKALTHALIGQGEKAKALLELAVQEQQRALRPNPQHPTYRQRLRDHFYQLANLLIDRGDHEGGARAALQLASHTDRPVDTQTAPASFAAAYSWPTRTGGHCQRFVAARRKPMGTRRWKFSGCAEAKAASGFRLERRRRSSAIADSPGFPRSVGGVHRRWTSWPAALVQLGMLFMETGKPEQSLPYFRDGLAVLEKLAEQLPEDLHLQRELGGFYSNQSLGQVLARRPAEAEKSYRKALAIQGKLLEKNPRD
jgi:tetratricopeptide (TPR) repeat protein